MGTIIPTKGNNNVEVSNGHVTSTGANNMILAIATPGLYQSLDLDELKDMNSITISYDTTSFKLNNIYNVTTTKLLDKTDLEKFNKLDNLYSKINLLSNSSKELVNGANKLNEGITAAKEGSDALTSGLNAKIKEQEETTVESVVDKTFTDEYKTEIATSTVVAFETKITDKFNTLHNTVIDENTGLTLGTLAAYYTEVQNGDMKHASFAPSCTAWSEDLTQYFQIAAMYQAINNPAVKPLIEGAISQTAPNVAYNAAIATATKSKETTIESLKTLAENITKLSTGVSQINDGATQLANGMQKFDNEGISLLAGYINGDLRSLETTAKELIQMGKDYDTYTMKNSTDEGNTKFVLVIDGKEKKAKVVKETKKEKDSKSLLDRIKNVFKK